MLNDDLACKTINLRKVLPLNKPMTNSYLQCILNNHSVCKCIDLISNFFSLKVVRLDLCNNEGDI